MKEVTKVFVRSWVFRSDEKTNKNNKIIKNVFEKIGITKYTERLYGYELVFDEGDKTFDLIVNELEQSGISVSTRKERVYSKSDTDNAELFLLYGTAMCGDGYNVYGTKFVESNKCSKCGSGEVQVSDLIIDKSKMGEKDFAVTYNNEMVISKRVADLLKENNLTGFGLRPVQHYTDKMKNEPELYQIMPVNTLPSMLSPPTVIEKSNEYCTFCGNSGQGLKSQPYYKRANLKIICDFNKTCEFFGVKLTRGTPIQAPIISQKAYQVFKENKVRNIKVEPIVIVD